MVVMLAPVPNAAVGALGKLIRLDDAVDIGDVERVAGGGFDFFAAKDELGRFDFPIGSSHIEGARAADALVGLALSAGHYTNRNTVAAAAVSRRPGRNFLRRSESE